MRSTWTVAASALVATGLGVWFALAVPLGLPYDEPAHWGTVLAYASGHGMPVLGDPGVPYEAQMGPVYYTLAALVLAATGGADQPHAPTVLRLAGVLLLPVLVLLTYRIGRLMSASSRVSATAAAIVATTPLLLMIGGSIQNDFLCFVLIALSLVVGMRLLRRPDSSWPTHLGLGVLIGLAILTKVVALALVPALALGYLAHRATWDRRLRWVMAAGVGVAVTSGWWFVRNLLTYGDLTGSRGMARLGIVFPPLRWTGSADAATWFGNIVSYVYIPVEYYRNVLRSPTPFRVIALLLAVCTVIALGAYVVRIKPAVPSWGTADPAVVFALTTLSFTVVGWLGFSVLLFAVPPRLAFHAAPVVAVVFAAACWRRPLGWLPAVTMLALLAGEVWLATSAARVSGLPFLFG